MQIFSSVLPINSRAKLALFAAICASVGAFTAYLWVDFQRLPARTSVMIKESDLAFTARLDTGATISSINAQAIEVVGGDGTPRASDVGKMARFTLINGAGDQARIEARIEQVRRIKTSDCWEIRYHVFLTLMHKRRPYRLLMNLNDRSRSKDKLLLGRNWLSHGFTVDISKN